MYLRSGFRGIFYNVSMKNLLRKYPAAGLVIVAVLGAVYLLFLQPSEYEKGKKKMILGEVDKAAVHFRKALKAGDLSPDIEKDIRLELGQAYLLKGALDHAGAQFRKAIEKFPDAAPAYLNLGYIHQMKGLDQFAGEYFQKAHDLAPGDVRTVLSLAPFYSRRGDFDAAQAMYTQALETHPGEAGLYGGLARVALRQGKFAEAVGRFESVVDLDRDNMQSHVNLGEALFLAGRRAKAMDKLKWILHKAPDFGSAKNLQGLILESRGEFDAARRLTLAQVEENAFHVAAGFRLIALDVKRRQLDLADSHLRKLELVLDQQRKDIPAFSGMHAVLEFSNRQSFLQWSKGEVHRLFARMELARQQYQDAERQLFQALQSDPQALAPLRDMVELNRLRLAQDKRAQWLDKTLALYPSHPYALLDKVVQLFEKGDWRKAGDYIERALDSAPELPRANAWRVRRLLKEGKTSQATEAAMAGLEKWPRDYETLLALGLTHASKKDWDQARIALEESARFNPSHALTWFELSRVNQRIGETAAAERHDMRAHELEPLVYPKSRKDE